MRTVACVPLSRSRESLHPVLGWTRVRYNEKTLDRRDAKRRRHAFGTNLISLFC